MQPCVMVGRNGCERLQKDSKLSRFPGIRAAQTVLWSLWTSVYTILTISPHYAFSSVAGKAEVVGLPLTVLFYHCRILCSELAELITPVTFFHSAVFLLWLWPPYKYINLRFIRSFIYFHLLYVILLILRSSHSFNHGCAQIHNDWDFIKKKHTYARLTDLWMHISAFLRTLCFSHETTYSFMHVVPGWDPWLRYIYMVSANTWLFFSLQMAFIISN